MVESSKFKIKYPSGMHQIVVFSIAVVILTSMLVRNYHNDDDISNVFYLLCAQILTYLIWLIILIYHKCKKSSVLMINPESLFLNGRTIEANQIMMVMVMGYFKPVLGIKPTNKKIVPLHLCFSFLDNEDKGMKELSEWAKDNQIPFKHKRFTRWI